MDGADLGEPGVELAGMHAVELLADVLIGAADPVTVVAVGPLTNVGPAPAPPSRGGRGHPRDRRDGRIDGRRQHRAAGRVQHLGGSEAAHIVFSSGLPVTMCGLDVTHQALATAPVLASLTALDTPLARTVVDLLGFFADRYRDLWGFEAPPVHDPVAVARVIDPALVSCVPAHIAIELRGEHTRGATVVDRFGVTGREPNAQVAVDSTRPRSGDTSRPRCARSAPSPRDPAAARRRVGQRRPHRGVSRLPGPGETVTGGRFARGHGGKGANQAVAARRAGAEVVLVGAVGDDEHGAWARAALEGEGIGLARLEVVTDAATGVALITVAADGANQIAVASGANARVDPRRAARAVGSSTRRGRPCCSPSRSRILR
jgi:hypothetical protein